MKWILSILVLIPFICNSQDSQHIEACESSSLIQEYWVDDGPNTYYWLVSGGGIVSGQGTSSIIVDWNNIPFGQYNLSVYTISNDGCMGDTSHLIIDIDECSFDGIFVPNSFTPNGDGINDVFSAIGENIVELEMFIYNRWGQEIYQSYTGKPWDGTYKDEMCQQDVYVWLAYYRFENENFMHKSIGHVVLLK